MMVKQYKKLKITQEKKLKKSSSYTNMFEDQKKKHGDQGAAKMGAIRIFPRKYSPARITLPKGTGDITFHPVSGEAKTIKSIMGRVIKEYDYSGYNIRTLGQRFKIMRMLTDAGLNVSAPIKFRIMRTPKGNKKIVSEVEEVKGVPVTELSGKAREDAFQKVEQEKKKIEEFLKHHLQAQYFAISDLNESNAVYNPKTRKIKFIDLEVDNKLMNKVIR